MHRSFAFYLTVFFSSLWLCLGYLTEVSAQERAEGQLQNTKGEPVAGVEVAMVGVRGVKTDASGYFNIPLPAGKSVTPSSKFTVNGHVARDLKIDNTGYIFITMKASHAEKLNFVSVFVLDTAKKPIPNLAVTLDGVVHTTDATGKFKLTLKNETKPNYNSFSAKDLSVKNVQEVDDRNVKIVVSGGNTSSRIAAFESKFNSVLANVEKEKESLIKNGEEIKKEIESISNELNNDKSKLTAEEKQALKDNLGKLQSALLANEEAFLAAQQQTKKVMSQLTSVIMQSQDSMRKEIQKLNIEKTQSEEESRRRIMFISLVAVVLLISAVGFFIIAKRIGRQKKEVEAANAALEITKNDLVDKMTQISQQKNEIELQKNTIEKRNISIMASMNYASRIQKAMLPPIENLGIKDSFILFKPRDIISGDFYWFSDIGDQRVIAIADCTGHGVPGAFMTVLGNDLLNEIVMHEGITHPGSVLQKLDELVIQTFHHDRSVEGMSKTLSRLGNATNINRVNDGMDISIVSYNKKTLEMEFSGAKQPLCRFRNGQIEWIRGSKFPIGSVQFRKPKVFESVKIDTQPGDIFYLFSDGYQDQFGSSKTKFLIRNFRKLLTDIHKLPFSVQRERLEASLDEWRGGGQTPQTDDILVMGFKI
ncbi:MAG: hypothetical protein EAZ57_08520 [Cytophagales bacterium]|nr:MAG: hypothetical protein EAZ67_05660 [Cytophagales bacterium]TAF60188.1 MAG: hypothetical protein EAZ57_08520 [Cytophagales bacterium]